MADQIQTGETPMQLQMTLGFLNRKSAIQSWEIVVENAFCDSTRMIAMRLTRDDE
jgi:hypothetical protein